MKQIRFDSEKQMYYYTEGEERFYLNIDADRYERTEDEMALFDVQSEDYPQYMQLCVYCIGNDGQLKKLDFQKENSSEDSNIAGYYQGDGVALVSEDDSPNRAGIYICGTWAQFEQEYLPTFYEAWGNE